MDSFLVFWCGFLVFDFLKEKEVISFIVDFIVFRKMKVRCDVRII